MEIVTTRWLDGWIDPLPAWDGDAVLVLAFGPSSMLDDPGPLRELAAAFPSSTVTGCSTSGAIAGTTIHDDGLVVTVVRGSSTTMQLASIDVAEAGGSGAAGCALGADLLAAGRRPAAIVVLSDGLGVDGGALVRGLTDALGGAGSPVPIVGGLAGDDDRFTRTWVLDGGEPRTGRVVAVGWYGDDLLCGHGSEGGWDIFGPERVVTRSDGQVLHEIDGHPALDLYQRYLGERAAGLPATALLFPLAVRSGVGAPWLVRTVLGIDDATGSMTFAGEVPQGATVQLMRSSNDRLVDGAVRAAEHCVVPDGPAGLALAVSCVGRRLVMGQRSEEELEGVLDVLPAGTTLTGFYSYGELSPTEDGPCELHNQTMTISHLVERA
jgi:hypothetical protein